MSKAQDNSRETQQKRLCGFNEEHQRDQEWDAIYNGVHIDLKTRHKDKGQTTKRRLRKGHFKETVIVCNPYDKSDSIMREGMCFIFPPALAEWTTEQDRKLEFDNGSIPCYEEIRKIKKLIFPMTPEVEEIFIKLNDQVHRNNSTIPKTFFNSKGKITSINRKKVKVKNPEWFISVPEDGDPARLLRESIDRYIEWKKNNGGHIGQSN